MGCGAESAVKGSVADRLARRAAQAVTHGAVRCSAWLGVSGADIDRSVTRWCFLGPAKCRQNIDGPLPKLNPRGMCVERLLGPNVWVRRAAGCTEGVVEVLERSALLRTETAATCHNVEPV